MNQQKIANFNLKESLKDFQVDVIELLRLNNVTEWSGTIIKEREEKIREAALILAGQCVAILLDNLSKSIEVQETAINQTLWLVEKENKKEWVKN